jgi:hypothetical protein
MNVELLLEAERRGILPPDMAGLLQEARSRGLVPGAQPQQPVTPPGQIPGAPPGLVAPPAMPEPAPIGQRIISTVRPTVEALGAAGGAVIGAGGGTLAAPGPGTALGGVTGAGLGYGLAKGGLDLLEQQLGYRQGPQTATEALTGGARDVLTGMAYETAGRLAAPIVAKGLERVGTPVAATVSRALDFRGRQATSIAREAAGKEIDAIRAALRGAAPGETPAQATAGIQRNAWQSLLELGQATDQMSVTLKNQTDDLMAELSRIAGGGNQTEIASAVDASRKVLNALTKPIRETSLDAANQQRANSLNYVNSLLGRIFLNKQVPPPPNLPPLNLDRLIASIDEARTQPGARVSQTQQRVLGELRMRLLRAAELNGGTIDAYDLYTIRKEGVNEIIDTLMAGRDPAVSKKVAADVLGIVRPEIDNAIMRAGGTDWKNYLDTFSMGAKDLEKRQMAGELLRIFGDSPQEYVKLVRGNNRDAVEAIFGPGNFDIFREMSKEMSTLNKVASYVERDGVIANAAKGGREELARILKSHRKHTLIPNWFNPWVTTANMQLRNIQDRLNEQTMQVIERAAQSNKSMLDLLEGLPRGERSKLVRIMNGLSSASKTAGARAAFVSVAPPEQQTPDQDIIRSPEEQEPIQ